MPGDGTHRRVLLKAVAGGAAAVGALAAASRSGLLSGRVSPSSREAGRPVLVLTADGSAVAELEAPLGSDLLPEVRPGLWRSAQLSTTAHSMVGFVWRRGQRDPRLSIRSRRGGRWTSWRRVPLMHDLPDAGDVEWTGKEGTQLLWVGRSDGIQVRLANGRPAGLTMVLLHPARLAGDPAPLGSQPLMRSVADDSLPDRPRMLGRKEWGADESWRNGAPRYNDTIEQVHVHHTANSNDYAEADVPGLLRGIYRYHTHSLGWSDIAYNFLVDRFGRTWVGRAGGAAKPVRGAHTLGFNATSTGIAVIGNYQTAVPSQETLGAIVRLAAWKLAMYGRDPEATVAVPSEGSDKFGVAQVAELPVIDGHRDTNDTACPGQHLYDQLPTIRTRTQRRMEAAQADPPIVVSQPFGLTGDTLLGQALTVTPGIFTPADAVVSYTWLRDGVPIPDALPVSSRTSLAEDVGHVIGVQVDLEHPDYTGVLESLTAPAIIQAQGQVILDAHARHGNIRVAVTVMTPGLVEAPTGEVMIRADHRSKRVKGLLNGCAVARLTGFGPGEHTIKVRYLGTDLIRGARATRTVRVHH